MSKRIRHPIFARYYAKVAGPALDKAGVGAHRDRLLSGLDGEVLEVGAGDGLNFHRYPPGVKHVVAVEPEPTLREYARRAAAAAPGTIDLVDGRAEALPFPDASFDAVVACLVLCSVRSQATALAEFRRVLRPGGTLRFFEHVQADSPGMQSVQRVLDRTIWPLLAGGCHLGRDTAAAVIAAGFELTDLDSFLFPDTRIPNPAGTHILGTAIRPDETPASDDTSA